MTVTAFILIVYRILGLRHCLIKKRKKLNDESQKSRLLYDKGNVNCYAFVSACANPTNYKNALKDKC